MQEKSEFLYNGIKKCQRFFDSKGGEAFLLSLFFVITAVFRLFHISSATHVKGTLLFIQPDAYYHIRRTILFAHNFPSLNSFDYYLAYPVGAECPWPPLYDWFLALLSLIAGGGKVDNYTVEWIHALFPVLSASLAIFPIYYTARLIWGKRSIGYIALFLWTFAPNALSYSVFISGDHHATEILLAGVFYYYGLKALKELVDGVKYEKSAYLAGLFAALGLLVWHIQIFYFTLWMIFTYIVVIVKRQDRAFVKELILLSLKMLSLPIVIATVVRILSPITTEQGIMRFDFFSFFQPLYILLLLLPALYYYLYISSHSKKTFIISSLIVIAFIAGVVFIYTPAISALKVIEVFLTKSEPYLTNIQEYKPLFRKGHFLWGGFFTVVNYFKFLYYAMPAILGLFYLGWFLFKGRLTKGDIVLFPLLLFMISTGILHFYQKRWGNESNYGGVLAHAVVISFLWQLGKGLKYKKILPYLFVAIYLVTIIAPMGKDATKLMVKKIAPIKADLYYMMKWISENTPKTSYYLNPTKKPEYGIMTPWDLGHLTIYYGERPVCASNFGHSLRGSGFRDSQAIWQVKEDKDLARICERNEVKFLLINDPLGYMTGLENMKFFYPFPAMRLMQYDGSFSPFGPALENFRLVKESSEKNENTYNLTDVRAFKLYEFVKGARISGKTLPLYDINISTTFRSDTGREFKWSLRTFADEKGEFHCVIPYATKNVKYPVRAMAPFKAVSNKREIVFDVDEEDVQLGREIRLNFLK